MDFKEFTTRAEQDIRAALEDASPGVGVGMNQVEKLQGESYTAIMTFKVLYVFQHKSLGPFGLDDSADIKEERALRLIFKSRCASEALLF